MRAYTCCSFCFSEALVMPGMIERATQKPHAEYVIIILSVLPYWQNDKYTYPQGIYCCCILDHTNEFTRFLKSQERASSKRFSICLHPATQTPTRVGSDEPHPIGVVFETVCLRKVNYFFIVLQICSNNSTKHKKSQKIIKPIKKYVSIYMT